MKAAKQKLPIIAACMVLLTAVCALYATHPTVNASAKNDIRCSIEAPEIAQTGDKTRFGLALNGKGTKVELVIDFGDAIDYLESEFFAFAEDDWNTDFDYELEQIEEGRYLLTAAGFDGTISMEGAGLFRSEGINRISVTGTYFSPDGAPQQLNEVFKTQIGNDTEEPEAVFMDELSDSKTDPAQSGEDIGEDWGEGISINHGEDISIDQEEDKEAAE